MKWEVIKREVARGVFTDITRGVGDTLGLILVDLLGSDFAAAKGRYSHEILEQYAEQARLRVMDWDVRCVGRLRELFPKHFPPSLQKGKLIAYLADNPNSDWMVEKAEPTQLAA